MFGIEYYLTGFIMMAVSGPLVFMSTISFSNFFPKYNGLITGWCVGSFDASSIAFVVLWYIIRYFFEHEHEDVFGWVFIGYSTIPFLLAVLSVLLYPNSAVEWSDYHTSTNSKSDPATFTDWGEATIDYE